MEKISIGDYVYVDFHHKNGTVTQCRGGYVGRWLIKLDDGTNTYASSRDLTVIRSAQPSSSSSRCSVNEKLDLILDYLGIEIDDQPRIIKKEVTDDTISSGKE